MNIGQIEENLSNLIKNFSRENFILSYAVRSKPFTFDEERLKHLFKLYEEITNTENSFNNNQLNSNR